jgi:hypothetical protein
MNGENERFSLLMAAKSGRPEKAADAFFSLFQPGQNSHTQRDAALSR